MRPERREPDCRIDRAVEPLRREPSSRWSLPTPRSSSAIFAALELARATLLRCSLVGCETDGATFDGADLRESDLFWTSLDPGRLWGSRTDHARWPDAQTIAYGPAGVAPPAVAPTSALPARRCLPPRRRKRRCVDPPTTRRTTPPPSGGNRRGSTGREKDRSDHVSLTPGDVHIIMVPSPGGPVPTPIPHALYVDHQGQRRRRR